MTASVVDVRDATLSDDGVYRYTLTRIWGVGPRDVWIMLNPSTADATADDPTIRRCIGFSRGWGAAGIVVVNLFALRATDPAELARHPDPIGPINNATIAIAASFARTTGGRIIAAWGAHPMAAERAWHLHMPMSCLGTTKAGAPRHPLYVKGDTGLQAYPLAVSA